MHLLSKVYSYYDSYFTCKSDSITLAEVKEKFRITYVLYSSENINESKILHVYVLIYVLDDFLTGFSEVILKKL